IQVQSQSIQFHGGGSRKRTFTSGNKTWEWPHKAVTPHKWKHPEFAGSLEEQFYSLSTISNSLGIAAQTSGVLGLESMRIEKSRTPISLNAVYLAAYDPGTTVNQKPLTAKWICQDGDLLRFFVVEDSEGSLVAHRVGAFVVRNHDRFAFLHPA